MAERREAADLTERQQFWLEHLRGWEKSGGSMASYAAAQGLEVRALYHWKRWLVNKGLFKTLHKRPRFKRVKVVDSPSAAGCRLHLPNGALLEWGSPLTVDDLGALLKVASKLS